MSDLATTGDPTQTGGGSGRQGTGSGPAKAYLELIELKNSNGSSDTSGGTRIDFQFNPKDFTVTKAAHWSDPTVPADKTSPVAQYLGARPATMNLELFLDGSADGTDVSKKVRQLMEACVPTSASTSRNTPLPPGVRFGWDQVYFEGYLLSISANYQLFRPNGTPVRALCKLELKEIEGQVPKQNPTSGSVSTQGSHPVIDGDSLPSIAYKEYGDATRWRRIAQANGIDDPMVLRPGTRLLIPPAPTGGPRR
ncbi:MAG: LysM peptidoglycan-binding domain-containing protein [Actinomycetota bacterium]